MRSKQGQWARHLSTIFWKSQWPLLFSKTPVVSFHWKNRYFGIFQETGRTVCTLCLRPLQEITDHYIICLGLCLSVCLGKKYHAVGTFLEWERDWAPVPQTRQKIFCVCLNINFLWHYPFYDKVNIRFFFTLHYAMMYCMQCCNW